jgi:hypothetical protein
MASRRSYRDGIALPMTAMWCAMQPMSVSRRRILDRALADALLGYRRVRDYGMELHAEANDLLGQAPEPHTA